MLWFAILRRHLRCFTCCARGVARRDSFYAAAAGACLVTIMVQAFIFSYLSVGRSLVVGHDCRARAHPVEKPYRILIFIRNEATGEYLTSNHATNPEALVLIRRFSIKPKLLWPTIGILTG